MYLALLEDVDHQYKTDLYFDEDGGVDIIEFIAPTYRPLLSSPVAREWLNSLGPHSLTPSLYKKIVAIMATWDNHSKSD